MRITSTTVQVRDAEAGAAALAAVLRLPCEHDDAGPHVRVGWTDVRPVVTPEPAADHLAILIPGDAYPTARTWLLDGTEPLDRGLDVAFPPPDWDSTSVYFDGPDGLVLELIAHRGHRPHGRAPFGPAGLLGVCEVGLAVPDVPAAVAASGLPVFAGTTSPGFAVVGDRDGRLVLVEPGRPWFPTADRIAGLAPLAVTAETDRTADLRLGEARVTLTAA